MCPGNLPDPDRKYPIPGYENEIFARADVQNPNIIVGEFTYIADSAFQRHVTHHYEFNGDRLIIGRFCQIAAGVEFVMNGANHQMNSVSTYPFFTMEGWDATLPSPSDMPLKGDTVIGNDVWIGQNAVILPGIHIGDGAIIGTSSVVSKDIPPYWIAAGNPVRLIRPRFDDEMIQLLLDFRWWDRPTEEIKKLVPLLTSGDTETVRNEIKQLLNKQQKGC